MIAIEIGADLKAATVENHAGEWCFIITHLNGKPAEKIFTVTGHWKDARPEAEAKARAFGCKDEMDSILLLTRFHS